MRGIILVIIYLVECLKYRIGYFLLFSGKLPKKWIPVIGGIPFFVAAFWGCLGKDGIYVLMYFCAVVGVLFAMPEKLSVRIMRIFTLCFVLTCLDGICGNFLAFFDSGQKMEIYWEDLQYLAASLIAGGIFLLFLFIKRRLCEEHYKKLLSLARRGMLLMVAVMAVFMLFTISGLGYAKDHIESEKFRRTVDWVSTISLLGVGMLGIFAIYVGNMNQKMEEMVRRELELQDMQKRYYEALLEKEEDTRKYRHDMNNHLLCLNALVEDGDILMLKEYLMKMKGQLELIQKRGYVSGNKILDVIFNYYISLLDEDVDVSLAGKLHEDLSLDEMELCTIFANLVQNAVEEIGRQEKGSKRFLKIQISQGKTYFQTQIRNSVSDGSWEEGDFRTSKKDKRNHGLGLKNVEKVIKDHGGSLEVWKEKFYFCVKVTLRNGEITV